MEGIESKAESQAQDSQNMSQNVERFQQYVKEILNLIEQDESFSEITPGIDDCKKSKLTKLVMELSAMYGALADQHVQLVEEVKNTRKSSFTPSSDSESRNKLLDSPVNTSKAKKTRVHDPEMLLKKISNVEKENLTLKKMNQDLTDENALLEAQKVNVDELKLKISESDRRIETLGKAFEGSRKQVSALEKENTELKALQQNLSSSAFNLLHWLREAGLVDQLGPTGQKIDDSDEQSDEEDDPNPEFEVKVDPDEQMKEFRKQLRENWCSDIERLRMELMEKGELNDDQNEKHDADTDELEHKVV